MPLPRSIARSRLKRRLVAEGIRGGYKYRDPSRIPVNPSPEDRAFEESRKRLSKFPPPVSEVPNDFARAITTPSGKNRTVIPRPSPFANGGRQ